MQGPSARFTFAETLPPASAQHKARREDAHSPEDGRVRHVQFVRPYSRPRTAGDAHFFGVDTVSRKRCGRMSAAAASPIRARSRDPARARDNDAVRRRSSFIEWSSTPYKFWCVHALTLPFAPLTYTMKRMPATRSWFE